MSYFIHARKRRWMLGFVLLSFTVLGSPLGSWGEETPLETVAHVDLDRYVGKWYEVARYPNRFERECDRNVTAEYTKQSGRILVVNSCLKADGKVKRSEGHAKVQDEPTNAKLAVTFFWPFYGQYWVIDLGQNYEYAVVGEPSRKYLWILSRTNSISEETYSEITGRLAAKGYDPTKLLRTKQQ
jgi:apolipoprotein D and lipocalin family protein